MQEGVRSGCGGLVCAPDAGVHAVRGGEGAGGAVGLPSGALFAMMPPTFAP
jgi:hypothetical protein